jgi:hypothetical protein
MGSPAYKAIIKTIGVETAMVGEPCTLLYPWVYQITNPLKRILSRTSGITILVDGFPLDEDLPDVNPLTGVITFAYDPEGDVTISASYVPTSELVGGFSYQLGIQGDILDDTNFKDARLAGFRSKIYGLLDVTVSFERHTDFSAKFINHKKNRDDVLIVIQPGGISGTGFIGWFVPEKVGEGGEIGGIEDESLSFNLDGDKTGAFSYFEPILLGLSISGTGIEGGDGDYLRLEGLTNGRLAFKYVDGVNEYILYWHEDGYWCFLEPAFVVSQAPHDLLPQDVAVWKILDPYEVVPVSITPIWSV